MGRPQMKFLTALSHMLVSQKSHPRLHCSRVVPDHKQLCPKRGKSSYGTSTPYSGSWHCFISSCPSFQQLICWSHTDFPLSRKKGVKEGGEETLDSNTKVRIYKLISNNHMKAGNQNWWKDGKWETLSIITGSGVRQSCWEQDVVRTHYLLPREKSAAMSIQAGLDSNTLPTSSSLAAK